MQLASSLMLFEMASSKESLPKVVKHLNQSGKESLPKVVKSFNSQKKGKKLDKEIPKESVPGWVDHEAWSSWLAYNRERGLTLKPSTISAQLNKLETLSKDEPQASIIQRSIERQWRSFFPDRTRTNESSGRGVKSSTNLADDLREQRRRALEN